MILISHGNIDCPVCGERECLIKMCAQICGSDEKTYCNECHLKCGQCEGRFDPDVTKVSDGPCSRESSTSILAKCMTALFLNYFSITQGQE